MEQIEMIIRKLQGELSEQEEGEFNAWLQASELHKAFYNQIKSLQGKGTEISKLSRLDIDRVWVAVLEKAAAQKHSVTRMPRLRIMFRYAAIFIVLLGLGYFIYFNYKEANKPQLLISKEDITLKLEDGHVEVIKAGENKTLTDASGKVIGFQKGEALHYEKIAAKDSLIYNELNIPYGRRLSLYLSDGTKVELNAGTKFKYPVHFMDTHPREVFLNGEAYFEVSHDEAHPFKVGTRNMDIRVLGTKFNITAYEDEADGFTTLVEGSVQIFPSDSLSLSPSLSHSLILKPGEQARIHADGQLSVKTVAPSLYTAWMKDAVIFTDVNFEDVVKKLERKYSVQIINHYNRLNLEKYTGRFESESILQILESFRYDIPFDYDIDGNKIIISEPAENNRK